MIMILPRIFSMFEGRGGRAICVWLILLASGCATTGKDLDDTRLAWVNGEAVTVQDLVGLAPGDDLGVEDQHAASSRASQS